MPDRTRYESKPGHNAAKRMGVGLAIVVVVAVVVAIVGIWWMPF